MLIEGIKCGGGKQAQNKGDGTQIIKLDGLGIADIDRLFIAMHYCL